MRNSLFLVCPTDHLECRINEKFGCENYFYTSLGNSFSYSIKTLESIRDLIEKQNIQEICFVLAQDNEIIQDAMGEQYFAYISGLRTFYKEIDRQKRFSAIWQEVHRFPFLILSYFLNKKIEELTLDLQYLLKAPITIKGKIFNKKEQTFEAIYSSLICTTMLHLN